MTRNYGASFGVFSGQTTLLSAITGIGIALVLVVLIVRPKAPKILRYSLIMIFAGGLGNLVDRIAFGYVRDFIDYTFLETFFGIDFAIGNIADIFVMIAMGMLIVYMIFGYKEGDLSKGGRLAPQAVTAAEERGEQVEADVVEEKSEEAADETRRKERALERRRMKGGELVFSARYCGASPKRLDEFVSDITSFTRSRARNLILDGCVTVCDKEVVSRRDI